MTPRTEATSSTRREPASAGAVRSDVDVVIVSFNSAGELRNAVAPLAGHEGIRIIVVDNASDDDSLTHVDDLDVTAIQRLTNDGFAAGCNAGWRTGRAPYVCFLNPDAILDAPGLWRLVEILDSELCVAAISPRIEEANGRLVHSQRTFPSIRATFARAFFLHRLLPSGSWADEIVRDRDVYDRPGLPDWVSGACVVVRRNALLAIDGWDEGFFLYGEDVDLCRRIRDAGWVVRFDPGTTARHIGGRSGSRSALLPVLALSYLRYARKHRSRAAAGAIRVGLALEALTHVFASRGGRERRRGHAAALAAVCGFVPQRAPRR